LRVVVLFIAFAVNLPEKLYAEPVVIVNKANPAASISIADLKLIYNGGKRKFDDGQTIQPASLEPENPVREEFFSRALHVAEESYRLYWLRMIFTGKGKPPVELKTEEEVVSFVTARKGGIAYIDSAKVSVDVKVLKVVENE
jgi:ABC-type phosphate transport system substrate-binding protein